MSIPGRVMETQDWLNEHHGSGHGLPTIEDAGHPTGHVEAARLPVRRATHHHRRQRRSGRRSSASHLYGGAEDIMTQYCKCGHAKGRHQWGMCYGASAAGNCPCRAFRKAVAPVEPDSEAVERKFAKGDHVRMSAHGLANLAQRNNTPTTGVVVGFGRSILSVWIRRRGRRSVSRYHVGFWEKAGKR